jgi:polysaccharide pyruvyl transferase WcaK-like protein
MTSSVVLTNAYSAGNSGDGLLVQLSVQGVVEAGGRVAAVIARDPESFDGVPVIGAPGTVGSRLQRAAEIAMALAGRLPRRLTSVIGDADAVMAVGGGYLRYGSMIESAKTRIVHESQLRQAVRSGKPLILLPQSIGPLGLHGRRLKKLLRDAQVIHVRDDRSPRDLSGLKNLARTPDLAVMEIGRTTLAAASQIPANNIAFVLRDLPDPGDYLRLISTLQARFGSQRFLIQSDAGTGNKDSGFLSSLGEAPESTLVEALKTAPPACVISVRLHGALEALLWGVPAVHLSYERKGFAAFRDLGLEDFVFNARSADADKVIAAIDSILMSPDDYWQRLGRHRHELTRNHTAFIDSIRLTR